MSTPSNPTPTTPSSAPKPHELSYILPHDHLAGARLNLQHYLLKECIGYTLHPSIPITPSASIADVATGTGIWLLDLSLKQPSTIQFSGFDISAAQFPPPHSLPPNITFSTLDASQDIPEELVGKFDIVHVALLIAVISSDSFDRWLANLMKLLKPGGWLQWVEGDFPGFTERVRDEPVDRERFPELARLTEMTVRSGVQTRGLTRWVLEMEERFARAGLVDVEYRRVEPPKRLERALSGSALLAIEETARMRGWEEVVELTKRAGEELGRGALYAGLFPVVAVGRKPE